MRNLLTNFTLFIALAITLTHLTGCPTATTQKGPTEEQNTRTNAPQSPPNDDEYPPPPVAISQAEIKLLDDKTFKLEDQKGKVILFNLWGIWCPPCIAEMPHLNEMQEKYRDRGFEIIGLNVGDDMGRQESEEKIKAFVEKRALNYQIGYADRQLFNEFTRIAQMGGVPISVLVSRNGKMVGIFSGGGPVVLGKMKETVEKFVKE